jgi:hypothetical protein
MGIWFGATTCNPYCECYFEYKTHFTSATRWSTTSCHCQQGGPIIGSLAHNHELSRFIFFCDNGPSMFWDSKHSCWAKPNVKKRKWVTWFHISTTHVFGLSKAIKYWFLSQVIDLNYLTWVIFLLPTFHIGTSAFMKGGVAWSQGHI